MDERGKCWDINEDTNGRTTRMTQPLMPSPAYELSFEHLASSPVVFTVFVFASILLMFFTFTTIDHDQGWEFSWMADSILQIANQIERPRRMPVESSTFLISSL